MTNVAKDPRKVFNEKLYNLGVKNEKIVGVSCDSAKGGGMKKFFDEFPERSVEVGISEQNAIGICAGLAKQGFIPITVVITPFITMRSYEQVRDDVGYMNMNVKIVGSGGGLAYSTLGSTHEAVEDIALMRTIPNMTILVPGDAYEVERSLELAFEIEGPVYIRMPRQPRLDIIDPSLRCIEAGKAEVIKDGNDIAIFATGTMVKEAQNAAELLNKKSIDAAVVDFMTVKPLDEETILEYYKKCKIVVSVEEHSTVNGFGAAIAQSVAAVKCNTPLYIIGVKEGSKVTGPYREILEYYGLTGNKIAEIIEKLI